MITILIAVVAFLLLVGLIVTIHEGGHFITALLCRIKILEFSIGLGPVIYQKKIGKEQILFTLRAIPMGGFVKPLDKSAVDADTWEKLPESDKVRAFDQVPRWKKALMVAGGPLSNFILAIFLFCGVFYFYGSTGPSPVIAEVQQNSIFEKAGIKEGDKILKINNIPVQLGQDAYTVLLDTVMKKSEFSMKIENEEGISNKTVKVTDLNYNTLLVSQSKFLGLYLETKTGDITISKVREDSPASNAGVLAGDIIKSIDSLPSHDISKTIRYIHNNPNKEIALIVNRDGKLKTLSVKVDSKETEHGNIGNIGIFADVPNPSNLTTLKYSVFQAFTEGISNTIRHTSTSISTTKKLILGEISTKAISGPLSIAEYSGESLQMGVKYFLQMMALISIAIGVFNLLPIPMLDGGHLLQYFIESIRGKNYSNKEVLLSNYIGIICLTGIFALAMSNDLIRYIKVIT